jgi:hypothetical protein
VRIFVWNLLRFQELEGTGEAKLFAKNVRELGMLNGNRGHHGLGVFNVFNP